jgi:hypothetical protein
LRNKNDKIDSGIGDIESGVRPIEQGLSAIDRALEEVDDTGSLIVRLALGYMCRKEKDDDNINRMQVDLSEYREAIAKADAYLCELTEAKAEKLLREMDLL